jgi:hypothetical protein
VGAEHGNPVSWQTIYFLLAALASTTATQPGGRVGGLSSRYGVYLRISPLVCIVDAGLAVGYLIFGFVFTGTSFRILLRHVLDCRFDEAEHRSDEAEWNGHSRRFDRETMFRWLFFVFAGLLPAIKLMALIGIPCSRAWGIMFVISFVVTEILLVLSKSAARTESMDLSQGPKLNPWFGTATVCAAITQMLIFYWANVGMLDRMLLGFNDSTFSTIGGKEYWSKDTERHVLYSIFMTFNTFLICFMIFLWPAVVLGYVWSVHARKLSKALRITLGIIFGLCSVGISSFFMYRYIPLSFDSENVPWWYMILLVPFWITIAGMYLCFVVCLHRWPTILGNVMPEQGRSASLTRTENSEEPVFDEMFGVCAVIFFLLHIFVPLFWYAFVYNPRWTYNVSWTSVFG